MNIQVKGHSHSDLLLKKLVQLIIRQCLGSNVYTLARGLSIDFEVMSKVTVIINDVLTNISCFIYLSFMLYIINLNKTTPKKCYPEHCTLQLVPQEDIHVLQKSVQNFSNWIFNSLLMLIFFEKEPLKVHCFRKSTTQVGSTRNSCKRSNKKGTITCI